MQIPSWAFANAGKSLFGYKSETDLQVRIIEPVKPVRIVEPVRIIGPIRDTIYHHLIELVDEIIPKQNAILNICIELYT